LKSEQQAATLEELAADNIRVDWQQAIAPGQPVAVAELNQYIYSLRMLYERRCWHQEGLSSFSRMAQRLAEASGAHADPEHQMVYGRVLLQVGFFHYMLGHRRAAADLCRQSLQLLQTSTVTEPDLIRDQAYAMRLLGSLHRRRGDYSAAKELMSQGIALLKTIADTYQEAYLAINLGMVIFDMGDYEEAEQLLRRCRAVFEAAGDRWDLADTIGYLGQIAYILGREVEAEQLLAESLSLSRNFCPLDQTPL
jgi:tetratricopeptide (TPR) repeat protein